jgi:hypothetical protein
VPLSLLVQERGLKHPNTIVGWGGFGSLLVQKRGLKLSNIFFPSGKMVSLLVRGWIETNSLFDVYQA